MGQIFIEPHIHMYSRTTDDYTNMYEAGIRVCVEPSFWLGASRRYAGTFLDYFELILSFESVRAARFGIDHYACISVNPKEAEDIRIAEEVIEQMPYYLKHPRCVAIGEIGFNRITENEQAVFVDQLALARDHDALVLIHTPHDTPEVSKRDGVARINEILRAGDYNLDKVLVDHNTEATIALARELPVWTGMTVYPYSKLNPERVVDIIKEYGLERMMVNSSADWGVSDPTSLAQTAAKMAAEGFSDADIKKLLFDNPLEFYSQCPRFKARTDLTPVPIEKFQR